MYVVPLYPGLYSKEHKENRERLLDKASNLSVTNKFKVTNVKNVLTSDGK